MAMGFYSLMGQNGLVQVVSQEAEAVRDSSSIKSGSPKRRRDNMLDVYILYLLLFFNVDILCYNINIYIYDMMYEAFYV